MEDVRGDPEAAAGRALELLAVRSGRYAIHLDVDVVDFTDAPLSEHPSRNTGPKLHEMLRALTVLASGPGLVAITLAELNPHKRRGRRWVAGALRGLTGRRHRLTAAAGTRLPQVRRRRAHRFIVDPAPAVVR